MGVDGQYSPLGTNGQQTFSYINPAIHVDLLEVLVSFHASPKKAEKNSMSRISS